MMMMMFMGCLTLGDVINLVLVLPFITFFSLFWPLHTSLHSSREHPQEENGDQEAACDEEDRKDRFLLCSRAPPAACWCGAPRYLRRADANRRS